MSEQGAERRPVIRLGPAIGTWAVGWAVGMIVVAYVVLVAVGADLDDITIPEVLVATAAAWAVLLGALVFTSRRFGTGDPTSDYALSFRPVDLVWAPVGVVAQIGLIPLLYLPLQEFWPDTFPDDKIEERARDLVDGATTSEVVLLVLLVVIGAPLVEELVYRGLLQRSIAAVVGALPALFVTAAWFALVHPVPIEYPGLFAAGLLFGAGVVLTGRIGPGIVTHAAFNATGLIVVLG